ncbi:hypothetical protein, partial [Streptomyces scabiei]|uniref:hypothetical protein n=1 Tax=Streptomyces scabiei TaxID=1930 RepID=UPI0038F71875
SRLSCHAARAGVEILRGETLASNAVMLHLARRCGFLLTPDPDVRGIVQLEKVLARSATPSLPCGASLQ